MEEISIHMKCECGEQEGWVTCDKETLPCPKCGRVYLGFYDEKKITIGYKVVRTTRR